MAGESDLTTLIRSMRAVLRPGAHVFVTVPAGEIVPATLSPVMTFREVEGLTLIVPRHEAEAAGLAFAFPSRMITLNVRSSLEAVGFLAAITARLAAAGISVNPVSAFHHDHLFVPAERADEAIGILEQLARAR
jgi:hypothetical protein